MKNRVKNLIFTHLSTVEKIVDNFSTVYQQEKDVENCGKLTQTLLNKTIYI
ncbi:MAG: hypothetical protein Q4B60_01480 [Erysipelotrichaceae bacterium]|nr:hypothetical protein [Erysipelotrichaceae bacterium]